MGVLNSSRKAMKGFIEKSYSMGQLHGEMKKINDPRRQNLIETVHLTKAEENKIDTLFVSTYGKKIKYDWHRLYQSFTGKFDENYFPEYLFSSVLEPKMNPMDYRYVLDDKLLLPLFCVGVEHVRTPRTYYSVCDGICFDEEKNIVDLKNDNFNGGGTEAIIKPVQDTSSGVGVEKIKGIEAIKNNLQEKAAKKGTSTTVVFYQNVGFGLEQAAEFFKRFCFLRRSSNGIAQLIFLRLKFGFHGSETLCNKFSVQLVQIDLPALFSIILLLRNFVDRRGEQIDLIEIFPQADIHKRLL